MQQKGKQKRSTKQEYEPAYHDKLESLIDSKLKYINYLPDKYLLSKPSELLKFPVDTAIYSHIMLIDGHFVMLVIDLSNNTPKLTVYESLPQTNSRRRYNSPDNFIKLIKETANKMRELVKENVSAFQREVDWEIIRKYFDITLEGACGYVYYHILDTINQKIEAEYKSMAFQQKLCSGADMTSQPIQYLLKAIEKRWDKLPKKIRDIYNSIDNVTKEEIDEAYKSCETTRI
jgi:hypothetical protein